MDRASLSMVKRQTSNKLLVAWNALCFHYKPLMVIAFMLLFRKLEACVLKQLNIDIEKWMLKFDQLSMRLATAGEPGADYSKNITQIMII